MSLARFTVCILLMFVASPLAWGQSSVPGLYDARVQVESQADDERRRATREGLEQVVVRMTGQREVLGDESVRDLVRGADRYVQQFGFETRETDDGDQLELRLRFDGQALQRALAEREISVWVEADRPRVLIWLAIDRAGDRELVGGDTALDVQQLVRDGARDAGLPVLMPLQDLEDRQRLSSSDVWGGFRGPILEASARYRAEVVLVGRLDRRGQEFAGRWLLFRDGETQEWSATDEELDAVLAAGTSGAAERLARALGRRPGERVVGDFTLQVDGLQGLADFTYVHRLLGETRGVGGVDVLRADGETLYLRIRLEGDSDRFIRDVEQGGRLERVRSDSMTSPAADAPTVDLGFRLRG
ncbi:hypothetical protein J2T57_002102 [Natronocella acetinitrilica]|uniref:DUF2066 domain-containing protein n=1 Tax=Natronocella acetinitrilica TaxID=414046 RepID=A0AAE3G3G9_9GAMM|nr:DUF2066 domain-containing protein [Natronocella acetinitrilica]MCP1674964.1 hypothetical protein [Natronocella acetinitrilica]